MMIRFVRNVFIPQLAVARRACASRAEASVLNITGLGVTSSGNPYSIPAALNDVLMAEGAHNYLRCWCKGSSNRADML